MATQIKRNGIKQAPRPTQAQLRAVWADAQAAEQDERDAAEAEIAAHEWAAYDTPAFMRGCACNACTRAAEEYARWAGGYTAASEERQTLERAGMAWAFDAVGVLKAVEQWGDILGRGARVG